MKPLYLLSHNAHVHHIWQDIEFSWGDSTHKVILSFDCVVFLYHVTHYFHYISISTEQSMVTRYDKEITTHCKEIQLVKLHDTLIWWSCEITRKMKNVKSPLIRPMDTKLGKIMTYYERLPFLKSHYPLITWPTWGNVTNWKVISPFSQDLLSLSLAGWLLQGGGSEHKRRNSQLFVYFWIRIKSENTWNIWSLRKKLCTHFCFAKRWFEVIKLFWSTNCSKNQEKFLQ